MDIRRFYVVSPRGERGPFSVEELVEELGAGRIAATQQVRTGMGTMLGTVRDVIDTPEAMWNTAESGSGMSPVAMAQRRNRNLSLVILALTLVPALALIALFGVGTTTVAVAVPAANPTPIIPLPPPRSESPSVAPLVSPASTTTDTPASSPTTKPATATTPAKPVEFTSTPDHLAAVAPSSGPLRQAADGTLNLTALTALITTKGARLIGKSTANPAISGWNDPGGGIEWKATIDRPGSFTVTITYACNHSGAGSEMGLTAGNRTIKDLTKDTGSWDDYKPHAFSETLTISEAGEHTVVLAPIKKKGLVFMKFSRIVLTPVR